MAGRVCLLPRSRIPGIGIRAGVVKILHVVGARPNFVKAAPVMRVLRGRARQMLVHSGQHHGAAMSGPESAETGLGMSMRFCQRQ